MCQHWHEIHLQQEWSHSSRILKEKRDHAGEKSTENVTKELREQGALHFTQSIKESKL